MTEDTTLDKMKLSIVNLDFESAQEAVKEAVSEAHDTIEKNLKAAGYG